MHTLQKHWQQLPEPSHLLAERPCETQLAADVKEDEEATQWKQQSVTDSKVSVRNVLK